MSERGTSEPNAIERLTRYLHTVQGLLVAITTVVLAGVGLAAAVGGVLDPSQPKPPDQTTAVQNIYNVPEDRGLQILRGQGFTNIRVLHVCSNSVAVGNVREVLLDNDAEVSDETALVTQFGSTGIEVP